MSLLCFSDESQLKNSPDRGGLYEILPTKRPSVWVVDIDLCPAPRRAVFSKLQREVNIYKVTVVIIERVN